MTNSVDVTTTSKPSTFSHCGVLRRRLYHCVELHTAMTEATSDELRTVFRLALKSQRHILTTLDHDARQRDPSAFRSLIEAILFTRRFVPTYLIILLVLVLVHGTCKKIRRVVITRKSIYPSEKTLRRDVKSPRSSASSSTLDVTSGTLSKDVEIDEQTHLLSIANSRYTRSLHQRTWARIRSFLLWQPRPIPALTAKYNTLPENETSIVILLFLALNLFYLIHRSDTSKYAAFAVADRAGLLFVVNLPILYVLAAKNNQPLKWLTGWSYEGLNVFHRRLGEWMTVMAIVHFTGMLISYYQLLAPAGLSLGWYLTRKIIIYGWIGGSAYMLIYATSIGYVRQKSYELFLASHIFLQVAGLVMIFLHHNNARLYVGAAAGIWVLDRIVTRWLLKTRSFIATLEIASDGDTVLLYCDIPLRRAGLFTRGIVRGWHAGQHVFVSVPGISLKHRAQAHPFTIASPAPVASSEAQSWPLLLVIRAQDGFSRELLEYTKLHQHTVVHLDGPYGSDDVLETIQASDRVCLVAGGSGIAVTYPLASASQVQLSLPDDLVQNRARYINGVKTLPKLQRLTCPNAGARFAHFWVRQDERHEQWIKLLPRAGHSTDQNELAYDLITNRYQTRHGSHTERPDMKVELRSWVHRSTAMSDGICVVVSGPDGLVRDVRNMAADLVRDGWRISVCVEKFGW